MKKTISLILALIFCFGLCSCNDDGDKITVVSKGMSPIINDGDTVFYHSIEDASKLSIGDIIVYWTIVDGQRVAYASRIKNIYDGGGYLIFETQDDNNEYANSLTVHESEIIGKFANTNPPRTDCSHSWRDATCFRPRTCDICGATEGGLSNHTWKDATYYAPKTCTVCGTTEGSKLPPMVAPDDNTAPELISFALDKTNVRVGDVITFTAEINDSSTIYYAEFQFKCGADYHNVFLENIGGNTYSGTLTITDSFVSGTYSISWISIQDYAGNDASPSSDAAFTVSNSNSTIVMAPGDTTAPELISFTLDKTNVKVGDVITFTAEINDSSTIYYAEFQFKCGADWHNVFLENVGGNIYSGTLEITDSFVSGTYSISWISIQDYAGNDASPSSDAAFTVTN